jgi:polyisoprenoid-binding protein YceI
MTYSTVDEIPGFVAGTWQIDSVCSEVLFDVRRMSIRNATGRLNRVKGTIVTDRDYGRSSVLATIDAISITTGGSKSDAHVRSERFLDVANLPDIAFQSTAVVLASSHLRLQGDLTIRGTTQAVMLEMDSVEFTPQLEGGARSPLQGNDASQSQRLWCSPQGPAQTIEQCVDPW